MGDQNLFNINPRAVFFFNEMNTEEFTGSAKAAVHAQHMHQ